MQTVVFLLIFLLQFVYFKPHFYLVLPGVNSSMPLFSATNNFLLSQSNVDCILVKTNLLLIDSTIYILVGDFYSHYFAVNNKKNHFPLFIVTTWIKKN